MLEWAAISFCREELGEVSYQTIPKELDVLKVVFSLSPSKKLLSVICRTWTRTFGTDVVWPLRAAVREHAYINVAQRTCHGELQLKSLQFPESGV